MIRLKLCGNILLINQNHFSGFLCFFFLKLKGELALTYESYAGGNLIVIVIEICNDYYLFYLVLAGSNKPFRMTASTSSGQYRHSIYRGPALTTVLVF